MSRFVVYPDGLADKFFDAASRYLEEVERLQKTIGPKGSDVEKVAPWSDVSVAYDGLYAAGLKRLGGDRRAAIQALGTFLASFAYSHETDLERGQALADVIDVTLHKLLAMNQQPPTRLRSGD